MDSKLQVLNLSAIFLNIMTMQQQFWMRNRLKNNRIKYFKMRENFKFRNKTQNCVIKYPITRNMWMKTRSHDWWNRIVEHHFTDEDWLENFRVTKSTFTYICNKLKCRLQPRENTICRTPLSTERKVAVAMYYLASCCEYRVVGNQFGISKSTVWKCVHDFVSAVNEILTPEWLNMPSEEEAVEIAKRFEEKCHLPNVLACIDGTHIPILPPSEGYRDFINRKGWSSLVLQVLVDDRYRFRNICIKNPGSTHDAAVLVESNLYKHAENILPQKDIQCFGKNVPYVILGDPAYPLLPWLLKNYRNTNISPEEDSFNCHMNSARVSVEIAIGRLKARFRCLSKRLDVNYEFVPDIVATCCTLHNILESQNNIVKSHWITVAQEDAILFPQPNTNVNRNYNNLNASNIRDHLKNYLTNNFPLRQSHIYQMRNNLL